MILGGLRVGLMLLAAAGLVHLLLRLWLRSRQRARLERRWAAEDLLGDREGWIAREMRLHDRGLKWRLLWLIYLLPVLAVAAIIHFVNE